MGKKLQRFIRNRRLTAEEATCEDSVREAVAREFPPRLALPAQQPAAFSQLLKQAIHDSGRWVEAVSGEAGLPPALVAAFRAGERDIHMATADKLARALGLEVTAE
jgi:hypothetical protein